MYKNKGIKLDAEHEKLIKLYKLRDYIECNIEPTDELYRLLMRTVESAINDKKDDIAILFGANIIKCDKKDKYVFEVDRHRIGAADVYLNGELMVSLLDEVIQVNDTDDVYTDIVNGCGSRIPNALFVKALLYCPTDDRCHLSDKVKSVLDRDIPESILQLQKKNIDLIRRSLQG